MNYVKSTPKGLVIISKFGINNKLAEKMSNISSYKFKELKRIYPFHESINVCKITKEDNSLKNKGINAIITMTSLPIPVITNIEKRIEANNLEALKMIGEIQDKFLKLFLDSEIAKYELQDLKDKIKFLFDERKED